jgi:hypothetical protein
MSIDVTTISVAIHRPNSNPIFGEQTIRVSLNDEGSGAFFSIEDHHGNSIDMDMDEIEQLVVEARTLYNQPKVVR